jgi:Tfp pilus tip-associated adhesin PilY1
MMGIMKKKYIIAVTGIVFCLSFIFTYNQGHTSDTCMFAVTADDLPPKIAILIDNGAVMKHPITHGDYDSSVNYTPNEATPVDVVADPDNGNGFFNNNGYGIFKHGQTNHLVPVADDLQLDTGTKLAENNGTTGAWTINNQTVTLPLVASTSEDGDGIIDNAGEFRYSKNYLNWLFYYTSATDLDGDSAVEPVYDGAALPDKSRFYYAKKALRTVGKLSSNKAKFALYNFANDEGSYNVQPIGDVVATLGATPQDNVLDPNFIHTINNMGTVIYSPLAEGMATIGGDIDSSAFGSVDSANYCEKTFVIVVSPGLSSMDKTDSNQAYPNPLKDDHDGDGTDGYGDSGPGQGTLTVDGQNHTIVTNYNGSTYMDDVAHFFYTEDMRRGPQPDDTEAVQIVSTYTVGFMATTESRLLLINTSNNGNGKTNLTDSSHKDYGKYHFDATSADGLSQAVLDAVNSIISRTNSFTAPVVPVTRTTSGDKIYMAFFKPLDQNFWEGNVTKFGLSADNEIIGSDNQPATWPNGAMREEAKPYWATIDWADTNKSNGIRNYNRKIYTYLGSADGLSSDLSNQFTTDNTALTAMILGNPTDVTVNGVTVSGREKVIQYIRGADVLDENADGESSENRAVITGDVLHSEPLVFTYTYADDSAETLVFFGSNDGMLHAVLDVSMDVSGDETVHGTEAWAFIPPNQLSRLKEIIEGSTHQDYVDSSPKIYFHDIDADGRVDSDDGDKVILICGLRKSGSGYFALDITDSDAPAYLWRIGSGNDAQTGTLELTNVIRYPVGTGTIQDGDTLALLSDGNSFDDAAVAAGDEFGDVFVTFADRTRYFEVGDLIGNLTMAMYDEYLAERTLGPFVLGKIVSVTTTDPDVVIPELGQSWSEPQFGTVKTADADTTGTAVFFIGGGYSADNSTGNAVLAVDVFTGAVVKKFTTAMNYSVVSNIKIVDADNNGFVDKVYVGDLGGQMWRFGQVNPLSFPDSDENINNWTAQILFTAPTYTIDSTTYTRKFFYPPSVTLEKGYDLLSMGTGDRENACDKTTAADRIYSIKDFHGTDSLTEDDLVDVTDPTAAVPNLDQTDGDVDSNDVYDQGWFIRLVDNSGASEVTEGEKILGQGVAFYKTYYVTTFTPNDDPCTPGGNAKLYAIDYKTGAAVIRFEDTDGDGEKDYSRSAVLGGGIPSKTVVVITVANQKLLVSLGSTNPDADSKALGAGIVSVDPLYPTRNFFYLWWRELLN